MGDFHSCIVSPGKGRCQDLIDMDFTVIDPLLQHPASLLCLLMAFFRKRTVGCSADFIFHIPDGLPVPDKIKMPHSLLLLLHKLIQLLCRCKPSLAHPAAYLYDEECCSYNILSPLKSGRNGGSP